MDNKNELAVINKETFIKVYNPEAMLCNFANVKTVKDAIKADSNGLSFYRKHVGPDAVLALIELHLVGLNQSINVGQPLTKYQCKEIAIEIMSNYYFLSMPEIQLVFRRAKRGEYGQFYGVLNMPSILDWFNQYSEERAQFFISDSEAQHLRDKSQNEVKDGKLKPKADALDQLALKVLAKVKEEAPKTSQNEAEFSKVKAEYIAKRLNDEQSDN